MPSHWCAVTQDHARHKWREHRAVPRGAFTSCGPVSAGGPAESAQSRRFFCVSDAVRDLARQLVEPGAPDHRSFTYVILSLSGSALRDYISCVADRWALRDRAGDRSDRAQTGPEGSEGVPASAETAVAHGTASEEATSGDVGTDRGGENPDAIDMTRSTSVPIGHLLPGGH